MFSEKIRCGAPKERSWEGVCDRKARTPYCTEHMHYAEEESLYKVVFEDRDDVLLVRARRLDDVCDFVKADVEIQRII